MTLGKVIGRGNTAEVLEMVEGNKVLKLFYEKIPLEYINKEYDTSRIINQLAIPSPHAHEIIKMKDKWGIVYDKVTGHNFTQTLSSLPFSLKKHALLFAELHTSIHRKSTNQLTPQKEYLARNISRTDHLSHEEKEEILRYLIHLPDDNKVCHGDFHPDNIILLAGKPMVLDWMTGTSGNPCGDVARTLIILRYSSLTPGMSMATKFVIQTVRKAFGNLYIKSYIKLTHTSVENIEQWFLPVMASRLVEGIPEQEKQFLLKKIREKIQLF